MAIEFVKVDVCQYRGEDSPLGRAAMRVMKPPVFHITGFQHLPDDMQKLVVSLDSVDEGATKNRWSLADRADRESQEAPDSSTTPP